MINTQINESDHLKVVSTLNEAVRDGDTDDWKKIKVGDVVGWTIEGMGRPPKLGEYFRIGPWTGTCVRIKDSKVFMKVEANSFDLNDSLTESVNQAEMKALLAEVAQNPTYKKALAICKKYGYELSPFCYRDGDYIYFNMQPSGSKLKPPVSYQLQYKGGKDTYQFEIQTTAHGSLTIKEYPKFLKSCESAYKMAVELDKLDMMTLVDRVEFLKQYNAE